uniref:Uncharacterized protein n=1 Tax=Ditylum brightwellii TaxID=49249 RepID=A0A7S4QQC7_9STRA
MTNMYHQSGSSPAATLLMRVRTSGRCPPSLIGEDRVTRGDDFEAIALRTLEGGASQGKHTAFATSTGRSSRESTRFQYCRKKFAPIISSRWRKNRLLSFSLSKLVCSKPL